MKILKQDNGYDNKLFYFDHKQKNKIIKSVKPLFNDNPNICSVKLKLQGYGLGIKIWYAESYSYKSKSKKYKDQILYRNHNIYIPINSNYDKRKYKNFVNYINSLINDRNTFKGLIISISHFSYGYVSKSSYNENIVYSCVNKTKTLIITKDNIYIKIKDNNSGKIKSFPVTCNYLIYELNLLQKEHRQQMINLIFDFLGEDNYLLKDVKRYYLKDLYFLAPIKIHQLVKYHNFNEMFSNEYKNTYNINFNTNDINFNYILLKIYEMIDKKDINKFIDDFKKKFAENRDRFVYPHYNFTQKYELAYKIINFIYFNHSECHENQNHVNYLYDYIMLCKQNKTKINIKRIKNIKKLHDEEMEKQMKLKEMDIKKKKKNVFIFDNNNIYKTLIDNMPAKYTLIDNEFDLYKEGEIQHNCVYSYKDKILNSKCIIYKYEKNEKKHFTIEIDYRYKTYRLKQIKNTYNQEPEPEDIEEVNNDIYLINKKLKKRA